MTILNVGLVKISLVHFNMAIIELATLYLIISETLETNLLKYDKLFEVTAFNEHERSVLYALQTSNESVIFLNGVTNEAAIPMQIIVNNCCVDKFENILRDEGIEYNTHDDLSAIYKDLTKEPLDMAYGFLKWENISKLIDKNLKQNPLLKKIVISNTYEKRELFMLSIAKSEENPAVVIIGGEQGKDWMSTAIILNLIKKLNKDFFLSLIEYYNFYFLPIFNPDGYAFSMAEDRFWDKNRKAFFPKKICNHPDGLNNIAVGVNIERNWYFENSLGSRDGTECSSVYLGQKPLFEEEPKALADFLNIHAINIMAFFNIKGFGGRLITLPYSDITMHSNNHGVVMEIIMSACEKVYQKFNSTYHHGQTAQFFYNVSGNSADWIKKHFNIPIVSTIHMKYTEENIPQSEHIEPLTQELDTIIEEILMISREIYGPLFNHQVELAKNTIAFALTASIIIYNSFVTINNTYT